MPMSAMKVLIANDLYGRSSAAGVAVRMAEGLAARGLEVSYLSTVQDKGAANEETVNGVRVRQVFTPPYPGRWKAWRSLDNSPGVAAMKAAVQDFVPDVVHVHNLHSHLSYAALAAARSGGAKVALHVHDVMPFCHQKLFCHLDERLVPGDEVVYRAGPLKCAVCVRGRFNPWRNKTIRRVLARDVDRLVAVSDEMGKALLANGLGSSTTIVNGVSEDTPLAPPEAVAALRERLGLGGRRVIFFGGRLDRLKGGLQLVEALALVQVKHPDAVLLMAGEALPGFNEEVSALAGRLGLSPGHLVHAGWLDGSELAAAYALADVVATPSLCFESFGLVNLEAMAAGRPVVASFWGGPSNVVVDGVTGFLVNPLQVAVLADRLGRILSDEALAEKLGAAGRARVRSVFGLRAQADAALGLYEEMVS